MTLRLGWSQRWAPVREPRPYGRPVDRSRALFLRLGRLGRGLLAMCLACRYVATGERQKGENHNVAVSGHVHVGCWLVAGGLGMEAGVASLVGARAAPITATRWRR